MPPGLASRSAAAGPGMAAEPLLPPRRVLLLLAFVLAASAALAGGLTATLLLRGQPSAAPAPAPRLAQAANCAVLPAALPDPAAALEAALGQRPVTPTVVTVPAAALTGLFAPSVALPSLALPPLALPGLASPSLAAPALPSPPMPVPMAVAPPPAAPIPPPAPAATAIPAPLPSGYALDLGYFLVPDQAQAFAARLQERGLPVRLLPQPDASGRVWMHVRTPPFAGSAQALAGAERIEREFGLAASLVPPAAPTQPQAGARP
jgi:cell division septation protein DedD